MPHAHNNISCQLYLVSPPALEPQAFAVQLANAIAGGNVGSFQLRLKNASDEQIIAATKTLLPICRKAGVAFIMNDRADLAKQLDCDGVHVGQEDLDQIHNPHPLASSLPSPLKGEGQGEGALAAIRKIIGKDRIIGITCHASKHLAMEAGEAGADYVAFGAFYPTTSKPAEKLEKWGTPTPEILEWWQAYMTLPCVAIGGITPANCAPLVKAGADFIAVITAVWNHPAGAKKAVEEFNEVLCV